MSGERPAIGDYALLSDCAAGALVSRTGSIDWACMPRLDRGSLCARLLDPAGGHISARPAAEFDVRREYVEGTLVLRTDLATGEGTLRLTDCFAAPSGDRSSVLLRLIEARDGAVPVELEVAPRFDYGAVEPWIRRHGEELYSAIGGDDALVIATTAELEFDGRHRLAGSARLEAGDGVVLALSSVAPEAFEGSGLPAHVSAGEVHRLIEEATEWWRDWSDGLRYQGPDREYVRRSALTLRGLSNESTGAIAAAATTSLPEGLDARGERNWDYRFSWVRDSSLAARSLRMIGFEDNADRFRRFIERSAAGNAADLQVVFGLGGERRLDTTEIKTLHGFRDATPVRVGNGAAQQLQLDAYGMILEQTHRWCESGHEIDDDYWRFLVDLVEAAIGRWQKPDSGFWETPERRHYTCSKVYCWVAVDRGLALAASTGREVPVAAWEGVRERMRAEIDERGVDSSRGTFVRELGGSDLDASLLRLPVVDYCAWSDPRMMATADAIADELDFGGLVRRYVAEDGFDVKEGAFGACGFWLAECFARQGRCDRARAIYERSLATANDLGLFSEEYDPGHSEMLGNFPQGLTHLSQIEAALALADAC